MTTTVDVPEDIMTRAMRSLNAKSPEEAIVKALQRAGNRDEMSAYEPPVDTDQKDLISLLGTCGDDSFLSPEELEKMRSED